MHQTSPLNPNNSFATPAAHQWPGVLLSGCAIARPAPPVPAHAPVVPGVLARRCRCIGSRCKNQRLSTPASAAEETTRWKIICSLGGSCGLPRFARNDGSEACIDGRPQALAVQAQAALPQAGALLVAGRGAIHITRLFPHQNGIAGSLVVIRVQALHQRARAATLALAQPVNNTRLAPTDVVGQVDVSVVLVLVQWHMHALLEGAFKLLNV